MPTMAMSTIAPTAIHSHGTLLVVVVVVVPFVVVDLSVVVAELPLGAVIVVEPPLVAGPVVVVVVLEPDVLLVCAKVIAGATARNSANKIRLSRKIGRISVLPLGIRWSYALLPTKA